MRLLAPASLIVACAILTACGGEVYRGYEGPDRSKEEIAVLDWSRQFPGRVKVWVNSIDGKINPKFLISTDSGGIRFAELLPGKHEIHWGASDKHSAFIPSMPLTLLIPVSRNVIIDDVGVIDMKAGHVYRVTGKECFFTCFPPGKHAAWIEDLTTGEVVLGSKELKRISADRRAQEGTRDNSAFGRQQDNRVCDMATEDGDWRKSSAFHNWIAEAHRRHLSLDDCAKILKAN